MASNDIWASCKKHTGITSSVLRMSSRGTLHRCSPWPGPALSATFSPSTHLRAYTLAHPSISGPSVFGVSLPLEACTWACLLSMRQGLILCYSIPNWQRVSGTLKEAFTRWSPLWSPLANVWVSHTASPALCHRSI